MCNSYVRVDTHTIMPLHVCIFGVTSSVSRCREEIQTLMQRARVSEAVLQATPNDYRHLRVTPHYAVASLAPMSANKERIREDRRSRNDAWRRVTLKLY